MLSNLKGQFKALGFSSKAATKLRRPKRLTRKLRWKPSHTHAAIFSSPKSSLSLNVGGSDLTPVAQVPVCLKTQLAP